MIQITKVIEWDMGHRVPNHKSKCRNPHGHRYRLELTVAGPVGATSGDSAEGMVLDFGDVKSLMMSRIHDALDHGFMVHAGDSVLRPLFEDLQRQGFKVIVTPFVPTAENLAAWCYEQLAPCFPAGLRIAQVRLYETPNSWADFVPEV